MVCVQRTLTHWLRTTRSIPTRGFSLLPWQRVEGNVPSGWERGSEQALTDLRAV